MRGFWPNEKVMAGEWRKDTVLHKLAKWCERRLLLGADIVVSLTHVGVDHMRRMPFLQGRATWFEVIPTCVDTRLFQAGPGTRRPFTLGYVGSVGGRYRFDAVLDCFKLLRAVQPQARLRIISLGARAAILKELWLREVSESSVELTKEDRAGVARALGAVDAGILFYRTGLSSTLGTAPTRLGEFLAAGVPCLINAGVGDASGLLEQEGVGVILQDVDQPEQRQQAVQELIRLAAEPGIRQRCADVAERTFSLERAASGYDRLYRSLAANGSPAAGEFQEPLEAIHANRA
jgi:glycosyltransferase involved in cell wall biosynthesis